ncbi:PLP-dependent aminotransferase family protein [Acidaminobacter sp. JC074]|uniref:aminotransferase-like domain-containing protein n=1 Tax=Acidaminobacter sp. JC074 TaxID=2530199 RepID=UPI001F0E9026|nr:PLP-dependent aminotransferase family protein [Acidaminobacter sp. JC074]MCH4886980.1 PLP-dependent aminotransferase family protein [Acidaminobacter sp. JC074]
MSKKIQVNWQPDRKSKVSLSDQIVSYIKSKIYKGDWLVGDLLPSQRALSQTLGVNRSTIVDAFSELNALGIIESKTGKGTLIANSSWSMLLSKTPDWQNYISGSIHKSNLPTIQSINKYEFEEDIIRLSTGEIASDLMPHDAISSVLMKLAELKEPYNYLEPLGLEELRIQLSNYLKRYHLNFKPSEILIVSGSLQALQLISVSLLGENSTVLVEENSYVKSLKVFEYEKMNMKSVPTDSNGPIPWLIDEKELKSNALLYTIPTFHNPTGRLMSTSRRLELLDWCKHHHLPIIEDDAYRELYFDSMPPVPIKSYDDSGNVLYLGSISKSLAPGLRIGWIVGPESIIERLGDIKMQSDYGASSISQWMLTYLIKDGHYEKHLEVLRKELKDRCHHLNDLLIKHFSNIASWEVPEGGFYIWLKLNDHISTDILFDLALKEKLLINPGHIYAFKKHTYIRLSYCYASKDQLSDGIKKLADIIKKL